MSLASAHEDAGPSPAGSRAAGAVTAGELHVRAEDVAGCPLCGSTSTTWRTDCRDWQQPGLATRFGYERCDRCGACFLSPRPLESELGKVYPAGYEPYRDTPRQASNARGVRSVGAAMLRLLGRRLHRGLADTYTAREPGETLVDYGCGSSAFLDEARGRGFATVGVDFTDDVLKGVRAHGHAAVLAGDDFERAIAEGSVACLRMNHVVEHLYRPREALSAIREKLRPGGRIHLSTPNPLSVGSRVFRRRWHALDCPRHVVLYPPAVLTGVLQELGFGEISVVHEVGTKDLARSWGIVLYDRGRIAHERIAAMASDAPRAALLLPVASAAALLSSADRYHVFAHRV